MVRGASPGAQNAADVGERGRPGRKEGKGVFSTTRATSTASVMSNSSFSSPHISRPLFPFVLICKSVSRQKKVGLGRAEVGLPVLLLFLIRPPQGLKQGLVPAGAQSICVG